MKLYVFQVAPNPTRVRLYVAEKEAAGTAMGIEEVSVNLPRGEQRTHEHLGRNPLGSLPVLELEDGSHLTESLAIIEYLEELHPEPPLLGRTALERARSREAERIAETGVLVPVAWIVHTTNSPLGLPPRPQAAELFRGRLPAALRVLDDRLADGRRFLTGATPSVADCTLAAAFQFARFGKVEIDPSFARLARWDERFRERESAKRVLVV